MSRINPHQFFRISLLRYHQLNRTFIIYQLISMIMAENLSSPTQSGRSTEEEARIRGYIRLIIFVFVAVVIWYGFDLADL